MEVYSTEEQQVEAIKKFWQENGTNIIIGAVLGFGGFGGWNWYKDQQISEKEAASAQYEEFVNVAAEENVNSDSLNQELAKFTAAHGESGYNIFVQLVAAKQAVTDGKFEQAEKSLAAAAKQTEDESLKSLILVRQARVQVQLEKFDAALSTLGTVTNEAFAATASELKGDVYLAQGNADKARTEYQAAADKGGLEGNALLKMKLDDLAVSTASNS